MAMVEQSSPNLEDVLREIILVSKKMPQFFEQSLKRVDLTLTEFLMLQQLSLAGPTPMAKLGDETLVSKAAVTGITDELEGKGFVKRVRGSRDRRVVHVEITPEGRKQFAVAKRMQDDMVRRLASLLSPDEIRNLSDSYEKLNEFMGKESA